MSPARSVQLLLLWWIGCLIDRDSCAQIEDCSSQGGRSSFLWRIDRQPPAYLLGTIHVPYTAVWAGLSPGVMQALDSAHTVHFELDLTSNDTLMELRRCRLIQEAGTQLEDLLPDGMTDRISRYLATLSQHLAQPHLQSVLAALTKNWRRQRPIWLALSLASLTPGDLATFGTDVLDVYLTRRARQRGQVVKALESAADQCRPLNLIPPTEAALAMNLTLTYLEEQLARYLDNEADRRRRQSVLVNDGEFTSSTDLVRRYRCGTLDDDYASNNASFLPTEAVARLGEPQLSVYRSLLRRLKRTLIQKRNRRMAVRVMEALKAVGGRPQLFAVGIGHLLGEEHSIVTHLREAGYTVRLMRWNQTDSSLPAVARDHDQELPPLDSQGYPDWRFAEQQRQRQQQDASRAAEWAIWEEAKKYARFKWRPPKPEESEEQWNPSGELSDSGESINLIKSAGSTHGVTLLSCLVWTFCLAVACSKAIH